MRVLAAFALLAIGCSGSSPPAPSASTSPSQINAARACVLCPGTVRIARLQPTDPASRTIVPELDAQAIAQRLGRLDLVNVIEEKIAAAEAQVRSVPSDAQAAAIVDTLIADLDRLAKN